MDKNKQLIYGIIGSLMLIFLKHPLNLYLSSGIFMGYVTDFIVSILAFIGLVCLVWFSSILIIDTVKSLRK